jgi:hypothetical protein
MTTLRLNHFRRTPVVSLLLMLALLVAQSVALSHLYSHLKAGTGSSDFAATAGQVCSECLSSAALLGAASSPDAPRVISFAAARVLAAPAIASHPQSSRHYAFRSRAPPELL